MRKQNHAEGQTVDLRADEPHPVAALVSRPDFRKGPVMDTFLRLGEPGQVERVSLVVGLIVARHDFTHRFHSRGGL